MNYLESKVKELFEQVLRGEKRVPKLETNDVYSGISDRFFKNYHMRFSDNLSIVKGDWIVVLMQDKIIRLFEDEYKEYMKPRTEIEIDETTGEIEIFTKEKPKPSEENVELNRLFREVWEYFKNVENDKWLIDKVFGELE